MFVYIYNIMYTETATKSENKCENQDLFPKMRKYSWTLQFRAVEIVLKTHLPKNIVIEQMVWNLPLYCANSNVMEMNACVAGLNNLSIIPTLEQIITVFMCLYFHFELFFQI